MTATNWDKDIRFPEKKVDDSWKESIDKDRHVAALASDKKDASPGTPSQKKQETLKPFVNLVSSLGYQAMMHLGEIASPENPEPEINLDAAREIIDLIAAVKVKTERNRSLEEDQMITALLSQLQMKFAQHA